MSNIIEILKTDYQNFPENQTFDIYDQNVYFKDPLNEFRGIKRYQKMIQFLANFFQDIKMEVREISEKDDIIKTEWTLYLTSPFPWKPRLAISGYSELKLNQDQKIISHIDGWYCSIFDVLKQNFRS
jgi:hypothetical protein